MHGLSIIEQEMILRSDWKMATKIFNATRIAELLRDAPPYVFVDRAELLDSGRVIGHRYFPEDEWFFKCHFPGNPIVPGVFVLEAIMQTAALCAYAQDDTDFVYAKKLKEVDFIAAVLPGDNLTVDITALRIRRGLVSAVGRATVDRGKGEIVVCKAAFDMVIPGVINQLVPKGR